MGRRSKSCAKSQRPCVIRAAPITSSQSRQGRTMLAPGLGFIAPFIDQRRQTKQFVGRGTIDHITVKGA